MIPILYDKKGVNRIGLLSDCIKCEVLEERNGEFELTLIYPSNSELLEGLDKENIIISDANDFLKNQKFRIYNTRKLMSNRIEVRARHISFDLAHDWIDTISIDNQPCEYVLNTIFRNSQHSTHYRGYSDIVMSANYNMNKANCIEAIGGKTGSILDTFGNGAEILRDNTDIHILNNRGHDNEVSIEYRKNLTGLTVEEDTTDLVTRIRPYAVVTDNDGNEVETMGNFIDSPLINNYAHPYVKYIDYSSEFDDENTPTVAKLHSLAVKEYEVNKIDIPKLNYKIEFVPLSKCAGYEGLEDRINLCDTVTIRDTRYNIDTQAKVIKVVYNVLRNRYDKMELGEPRTTLGDVIGGSNSAVQGPPGPPGPQGPAGADGSIGDFPNTLPPTPVITTKLYGFASIELSWTFENKTYYSYELYASKTANFTPNTFNLLFAGQASTFLHQVKPKETWYYRVCAVNTHGQRTEFSEQCTVNTVKIEDLSDYVESASIGDALIGTLSLDRGWVGQLHGNWIDAKQLSVTDGNGKRTLDIDSYGNVNLDVSELKINSKDVLNQEQTETLIEAKAGEISLEVAKKEIDIARGEITDKIAQINIDVDSITNEVSSIKDSSFGGNNLVTNGNFSNGTSHWEATKYNGPGIFEFAVFNEDNSNSWCLNNKKIGWCSAEDLPIEESVIGEWALCQEFDTVIGQTYTVSYFISGHRSSKSVVMRNGLGTLWDDISEQKWYGHLNGGKADSGWKWDSITFVAQHTKSVVWFRMHGRIAEYDDVNSMYLWIADVCCVEGKMASKWIPNIDEYYNRTEANTLIQQTADGINETLNKTIEISKSEAINQANLTTDNKLQSYPTKTEMNIEIDKRANGIVSTVKKIEKSLVTDNLLMEGDFSNNLHSWRYYDQGYPISCEAQNSSDWIMPAKVALHLNASYHPAGVDSGITQTFYTKWYTNYTITGYIASHRAEGMVILKDDAGNWLTFDKTNPDQDDYTGGSDIARWRRVKFTYYSGERGQMQLCLALAKSNENGHVWFHDFMITEGDDELCWKPSVRETRTQISQLNDKIETKASIDNMWAYIQQNPYAVMTAINNGRGINGISIDENGLSVFRNNIISMMLNDGKTQLYNPYSGTYMGYFGTEDNDLRVQLTGASTFSVRGGYNDVRMLDLDFNHGHAYGNSTMRICGDVLFQHRDNPNATGVNGLGLGNDDRADMYGHHNIFLLCHNSFGIADNNGYTNMFADARRGRWIMKGGLYQNTESPPSAYILSIDEEHPFFCGKTKMNIVDSILNLETTIKVDNEDDLTMMILPNDDDLVMTDIGNQKHIDQSSIIAGLVETVKLLNNRMLELESELNKRGR